MAFSGALLHNTKLLCDQHCKDKVVLFFAAKFPQIHNNIASDLSIAIKWFLLTCMCKKQWDPFCREWNLVFWPNEFNNLIPSEAILRSPSAARRSKAKRGIRLLSEWVVKKLNFTRDLMNPTVSCTYKLTWSFVWL